MIRQSFLAKVLHTKKGLVYRLENTKDKSIINTKDKNIIKQRFKEKNHKHYTLNASKKMKDPLITFTIQSVLYTQWNTTQP